MPSPRNVGRLTGTGTASRLSLQDERHPYTDRRTEPEPSELAAGVRSRIAEKLLTHPQVTQALLSSLAVHARLPLELPDAGLGGCCQGSAVMGPDHCTCWVPVYDLEQQPVRSGPAGLQPQLCADCAYKPRSPERRGDAGYDGDAGSLDDLVRSGEPFWCHQGIRRPVAWRHPSGMEIPGHPGDYSPPIEGGKPYKADGSPGDLCAGWATRRLKHMDRERKRRRQP
jgi:hypothetical protein